MTHDKDAALDQALNLFWQKGYAATSLKDLEKATGMHPGSIYAAFGSKAKLYCLSMERYATELDSARDAVLRAAPSPLEGLARFIETVHPLSSKDAPLPVCFLVKATLETSHGDDAIEAKLSELLRLNDQLFEEVFQAAIDAGDVPKTTDPKRLARQLSADLAGLCFYVSRESDPAILRDMISDLANRVRKSPAAA